MDDLVASLHVPVRFRVRFTRHAFAPDNPALAELMPGTGGRPARVLVAIDAGLVAAWPGAADAIATWFRAQSERVHLTAWPEVVPGGEAAKADRSVVDRLCALAADQHLCRHSYLLAVGGGAMLDAVGLAAALVHRGLRLVRMPTTTLAQCDGGLGVKNAINAFGQKNFLGTFQAPWAVLDDLALLERQDDRSWRAGIAEAVKVGVIKDAAAIGELEQLAPRLARRDPAALETVIRRCAALHLDHICQGGDPFEQGSSRPLDFGHWSAHRLEVLSRHRLLHGEAVAIGVALDCAYAVTHGWLAAADGERIARILHTVGLPLWDAAADLRDAQGHRQILGGLEQFREHLGGSLTLAMPQGLGRRHDISAMPAEEVEQAITLLQAWRRSFATRSDRISLSH